MRALALLLGAWHGLMAVAAFAYGLLVTISVTTSLGDPGAWPYFLFGATLLFGGFGSVVALALAAQGGERSQGAAFALVLPVVAYALWGAAWLHGVWFPALALLPGAVLGLLVLGAKGEFPE